MTVIIIIVIIIIVVRSVKKASQGKGVIGRIKNGDYSSAAELAKMKAKLAMDKQGLSILRQSKSETHRKRLNAKSADERNYYAEREDELEMKIQEMEQTVKMDEKLIYGYENNQSNLLSDFNNGEGYDEDDYDNSYEDYNVYDDDYYDANKPQQTKIQAHQITVIM